GGAGFVGAGALHSGRKATQTDNYRRLVVGPIRSTCPRISRYSSRRDRSPTIASWPSPSPISITTHERSQTSSPQPRSSPTLIWKARHGEALSVENGGIASRDLIYVEDIARGLTCPTRRAR